LTGRAARRGMLHPSAVLVTAGTAAGLLGAGRPLSRHVEAPPTARTGGFGEATCVECHLEFPLNAPGGRLTLMGAPEVFEPGRTYTLTIRLESEDMVRAGFQIAARFENGEYAGGPAGELFALDGRTAVTADSVTAVPYAHHTRLGTPVADPTVATWSMGWTAPLGGADIVFHLTANSANGDDSPLGDLIYTAVARTSVGSR
jgi:hypothetical protein